MLQHQHTPKTHIDLPHSHISSHSGKASNHTENCRTCARESCASSQLLMLTFLLFGSASPSTARVSRASPNPQYPKPCATACSAKEMHENNTWQSTMQLSTHSKMAPPATTATSSSAVQMRFSCCMLALVLPAGPKTAQSPCSRRQMCFASCLRHSLPIQSLKVRCLDLSKSP